MGIARYAPTDPFINYLEVNSTLMKVIIQRVTSASINVDNQRIAESQNLGILALVGFGQNDTEDLIPIALDKIINLRIFSNPQGRFDYSLQDIKGDLTLVPQFTLFADTTKGRRPEFFSAMKPDLATLFFDKLVFQAKEILTEQRVFSGIFGADMKVSLINDGPVTIMLEI